LLCRYLFKLLDGPTRPTAKAHFPTATTQFAGAAKAYVSPELPTSTETESATSRGQLGKQLGRVFLGNYLRDGGRVLIFKRVNSRGRRLALRSAGYPGDTKILGEFFPTPQCWNATPITTTTFVWHFSDGQALATDSPCNHRQRPPAHFEQLHSHWFRYDIGWDHGARTR